MPCMMMAGVVSSSVFMVGGCAEPPPSWPVTEHVVFGGASLVDPQIPPARLRRRRPRTPLGRPPTACQQGSEPSAGATVETHCPHASGAFQPLPVRSMAARRNK
jgi:hypothetical protein